MNRRRFRSPIVNVDAHEHVLWSSLGVFNKHVEVAVVVENAGVEQLELRLAGVAFAPPVLLHKLRVRKFPLRILVEHLQVRVRGRGVEVVVKFLCIFAVIALTVREAENTLLQNRVSAVPQREREAEALLVVANPRDSVLTPAIRAAAGMVVREIFPGVAVCRVILPHCAPLAFGKIWAEAAPELSLGVSRGQSA